MVDQVCDQVSEEVVRQKSIQVSGPVVSQDYEQVLKQVVGSGSAHVSELVINQSRSEVSEIVTELSSSEISSKKRKATFTASHVIRKAIDQLCENLDFRFDVTSDDSDEYTHFSNNRSCGVHDCDENVFIACNECHPFLCYYHKNTTCDEHMSKTQTVMSSESNDTSSAYETAARKCKRRNVN